MIINATNITILCTYSLLFVHIMVLINALLKSTLLWWFCMLLESPFSKKKKQTLIAFQ